MKRFLSAIFVSLLCIIILDFTFGLVCEYLQGNANGGGTYKSDYIAHKSTEDVFILGSSHASHHYVPSIISDSIGMSVFNAGQDGNGIISMYGRLLLVTYRYFPKIVIYDVVNDYDVKVNDNHRYLNLLKVYYDIGDVSDIFANVDLKERYKMLSNFYQYNTQCAAMLQNSKFNIQAKGLHC